MGSMRNTFRQSGLTKKMLVVVASIFFVFSVGSASGQPSAAESDPELQAATALIKEKKNDEAVAALKSLTAKNKENAEAWYYLGVAYLQQGEIKKATPVLETATKLKPDFAEAFTALGYSLLRRGKLNDAKTATEKSLAIQPVSADAHYTLGVVNLRLGKRDEALRLAELTIQERPSMPDAYLLKSQSLVFFVSAALFQEDDTEKRLTRYREAADALEKYLELTPASDPARSLWQYQFNSLRIHSQPLQSPAIFTGKSVTTRVQLISKPAPEVPDGPRDEPLAGVVIMRAVFGADGQVKYILVIQGVSRPLMESSIEAAKKIKFIPATKDGKPVSMWMQLEYHYNLN